MVLSPQKKANRTAEQILDIAERLVQTRGFGNVSYADIAGELGITTASLHYHFPGKAELGKALISRYAERFADSLAEIDQNVHDPPAKLEAYADLYAGVLQGKRMCMCGILAAEYQTLPRPMRSAVVRFFDDNERWLAAVLAEGQANKSLSFTGPAGDVAQTVLSTLEGAMLVTRPYGDLARFNATVRRLLAALAT
jgi:TetR/AcrR family transcriptional repressor of nem operon